MLADHRFGSRDAACAEIERVLTFALGRRVEQVGPCADGEQWMVDVGDGDRPLLRSQDVTLSANGKVICAWHIVHGAVIAGADHHARERELADMSEADLRAALLNVRDELRAHDIRVELRSRECERAG